MKYGFESPLCSAVAAGRCRLVEQLSARFPSATSPRAYSPESICRIWCKLITAQMYQSSYNILLPFTSHITYFFLLIPSILLLQILHYPSPSESTPISLLHHQNPSSSTISLSLIFRWCFSAHNDKGVRSIAHVDPTHSGRSPIIMRVREVLSSSTDYCYPLLS